MSIRHVAAVFALVGPSSLVAETPSPSPSPSLRHLVFAAAYDARLNATVTASGFGSSGSINALGPQEKRSGLVTVDIVAASRDGALAVDVSERDANPGDAKPVRVGILDTDLFVAGGANLTEEERMILHGLSRGLLKPETLAPGTRWTEDVHAGSTAGRTTYTVTSVDDTAKTLVTTILGSSSARGLDGYSATTTGTMTYDVARSVPVAITMQTTRLTTRAIGPTRPRRP